MGQTLALIGRSLLEKKDPVPHMPALCQPAHALCFHHAHHNPAHVLLQRLQRQGTEFLPWPWLAGVKPQMSESIAWIFFPAHLWPLSCAESPWDPVQQAQPVLLSALTKEPAKGLAFLRLCRPPCQVVLQQHVHHGSLDLLLLQCL